MRKTIYIAGPLYTPAERIYLERIEKLCHELHFDTYLPHKDGGLAPANGSSTIPFFLEDIKGLEKADIVIAVLNGTDVDSGTSWEIGYAYSLKKKLFGIYEDTRIDDPLSALNLMITSSVKIFKSLKDLKKILKKELTKL